jgi:serine/threonine protein kinase
VTDGFPPASGAVGPGSTPGGAFGPGSQLAGYQLGEQIGRGGMAVVYRARDIRLDRWVALKILAPDIARDESFRQRFMRESRAAAAVDHPNIIPVFEAGEASGVLFIAMRYVSGGDVGTLARSGPMDTGRANSIVAQVAAALDAAHEAGLVHRDVKPANMLLGSVAGAGHPDHVYLSDFGLSKQSLSSAGLTLTGQFMGTLDYMAPEQIEGRPVDGRTDLYALACAAFELLSGQPPFRREQNLALMWAQISEPPPQLTSRRHGLPAGVDAVMGRALAKSPDQRQGSCLQFAAELQEACGLSWSANGQFRSSRPRPATEVAGPARTSDPAGPHPGAAAAAAAGFAAPANSPSGMAPPAYPPAGMAPTTPPPAGYVPPATGPVSPAPPATGPVPSRQPGSQPQPDGQWDAQYAQQWPAQPDQQQRPARPDQGWPAQPDHWAASPAAGQQWPAQPPASQHGPAQPYAQQWTPASDPAVGVPYQSGPGTPGSPGPRRGRTLAAVAGAVVVAVAVAAFALLHHGSGSGASAAGKTGSTGQQAPTHPAGSGGATSGSATSPATGASTPASTGTTAPVLNPAGTVTAYYAAINDHHYLRAWNLGGRHTASSFSAFKQGYSTTRHDTLVVTSASGDTVNGRLTAEQTDGTLKTYQGTYIVQNGTITSFDVRQIS